MGAMPPRIFWDFKAVIFTFPGTKICNIPFQMGGQWGGPQLRLGCPGPPRSYAIVGGAQLTGGWHSELKKVHTAGEFGGNWGPIKSYFHLQSQPPTLAAVAIVGGYLGGTSFSWGPHAPPPVATPLPIVSRWLNGDTVRHPSLHSISTCTHVTHDIAPYTLHSPAYIRGEFSVHLHSPVRKEI